jgi:hypothetical protein
MRRSISVARKSCSGWARSDIEMVEKSSTSCSPNASFGRLTAGSGSFTCGPPESVQGRFSAAVRLETDLRQFRRNRRDTDEEQAEVPGHPIAELEAIARAKRDAGFNRRSAAKLLTRLRDQLRKVRARRAIGIGFVGEDGTNNGGKDQSHESDAGE